MSACERAQPLEDTRARPAVGNIGQTGRPAQAPPAAIATPLVDASGTPAVGNIGQSGAPKRERPRRVQRVQRSVHHTPAPALEVRRVERPLVSREERPMVGNVMTKGVAPKIQQHSTSAEAQRPLRDRRERPAVANMGRRGHLEPSEDNLALMQRAIAFERESLRIDPNDEDAARRLERLLENYELMRREAHEEQQRQ
ncbi:MAG: hypothetical protein M4D80_01260 [Myxococcota bacterium]|nr:hypothetical protein [Myxococcota bacterium]